jgi:ATP/maltotriose-dependent transcriptional regulator MalT
LLQQAISESPTTRDPTRLGVLLTKLGRCHWQAGHNDKALEAYRGARTVLETAAGPELADALAAEAGALTHQGRYAEARPLAAEAVTLARRLGARREEGFALNMLGVALTMAGEAAAGITAIRSALELARADASLEPIIRSYANLSFALDTAGELDDAADAAIRGFQEVLQRGAPVTLNLLPLAANAIGSLFRSGRWREATEFSRQLPELTDMSGIALHVAAEIAQLQIATGELESAAETLALAEEGSKEEDDYQLSSQLAALSAELALWSGDPDRAAAAVAGRLAPDAGHEDHQLSTQLCWLAARAAADQAERAGHRRRNDAPQTWGLAAAGRVVEACQAQKLAATDPETAAWTTLFEAERARAEGRADVEAWVAAVDRWHKVGQPYPALYAGWRHAEALLAHRRRSPAARVLAEVIAAAEQLGARLLRQEALNLARVAGLDRADLATPPGPPAEQSPVPAHTRLTRRELDVLLLLAEGHTYRQIGRSLFIAEKTVSVHVTHLYEKLGAANRGQAVARARQLGLLG